MAVKLDHSYPLHIRMATGTSNMEGDPNETCVICDESLCIEIEEDDQDDPTTPSFIYDDVEFTCGHHVHYECYREAANIDRARCLASGCGRDILTHGKLVVTVRNEGGVTCNFDLGTDLEEQRTLEGDPEALANESFLSFMLQGDEEAAQAMLDKGAHVNAVHHVIGITALHLVAMNNDAAGIRFLLSRGADTEVRASNGQTPLEYAIAEGAHEAAIALQSRD